MQAQRSIEGGHDPCQVTRIAREDHSLAHQVGAAVGAAGHVPANYGAPVSETLEPPPPEVGVSGADAAEAVLAEAAAVIEPLEQAVEMTPLDFPRRLLLVHAHPDDESITCGATMAKYAAEGTLVTLVTCTLGEEGEILDPTVEHLAADREDGLGQHRIGELAAAMEALRVRDFRFLGGPGRYRDSGMMGVPSNERPECFWQATWTRRPGCWWLSCARCVHRSWSPTTRTAATATRTTSRRTGSRWRPSPKPPTQRTPRRSVSRGRPASCTTQRCRSRCCRPRSTQCASPAGRCSKALSPSMTCRSAYRTRS